MKWGVGVIGAGPGAAALHVPTIARVGDAFRLVHIADAGSGRARGVAEGMGVRASSGIEALLADPDVDVVAICSPPSEHAAHVRAALVAGKRAILCEKPVGTTREEARAVLDECAEAGVLLVVGTNHLFDPAWSRAKHHLDAGGSPISTVTVTLALAPNGRYHDLVMGSPPVPGQARPPLDLTDPELSAAIVRQLVVGLAVHDLPLVRDLLPGFERVEFARAVPPIGFDIGLRTGGALVRLSAVMLPDGADSLWRLSIATSHDRIDVEFPPPFVHAGSARSTVRDISGRTTVYRTEPLDGYEAEWRALASLLAGESAMEYAELLSDALDVIEIADAAADLVRQGGAR